MLKAPVNRPILNKRLSEEYRLATPRTGQAVYSLYQLCLPLVPYLCKVSKNQESFLQWP